MNIIRPVQESDLDDIYELSAHTKVGLTTLPHDKTFLQERIQASERTFKRLPQKPNGRVFMFVLENLDTNQVIGTSAIFTKVGGFEPFWTYEIRNQIHQSSTLNVKKEISYLQLKAEHNGPSEIGTLFLSPHHRKGINGRMLSLSRFIFMSEFSQCFEDKVLAELRGVIDDNGKAVFWEAVGSHFFDIPFQKADLMVNKDKSFIADLMPKHPIYIPLLPKEAQAVLGKTHPETKPARCLLEQEGFCFENEIDIFEAGPVLGCKVKKIRVVQDCQTAIFSGTSSSQEKESELYFIARKGSAESFRLAVSSIEPISNNQINVSTETQQALKLKPGDEIIYSPLRKNA